MRLFWETASAEMLDAFVIAYRAYPPLLRLVAEDEDALLIVRNVVEAANDHDHAREAGIALPVAEPRERRGLLTPREAEVLSLMEEGLSNADIAARLVVSEATVKVHVHHILEKLGAKTRLQAVLMSK